jgi:hypothetical protein
VIQAGMYLRMSRDAEARGLGIGRQRKDGEALAGRLGWPVVRVQRQRPVGLQVLPQAPPGLRPDAPGPARRHDEHGGRLRPGPARPPAQGAGGAAGGLRSRPRLAHRRRLGARSMSATPMTCSGPASWPPSTPKSPTTSPGGSAASSRSWPNGADPTAVHGAMAIGLTSAPSNLMKPPSSRSWPAGRWLASPWPRCVESSTPAASQPRPGAAGVPRPCGAS